MQTAIQFFKEMSPIRLAMTCIVIIAFFVMFAFYLNRVNESDYGVLYSELEMQDSAKIVQELGQMNIAHQTLYDGSVIKVPKALVVETRLALAGKGLPNSGSIVGYEIFDKEDSIGATNFSQNIKLIRALEGELSRTIAAFDSISKARVHLVMPQRQIFSKERVQPRASVVLKFRNNKKLGQSEIDAISHLVVTAVPDLEMRNITIVDTKGKALKIGSNEESLDFVSNKNEEIRITNENRLRQTIEELLQNTIGTGGIKASVALEMNFDRIVTNSESFDPEGSVIRSTQSIDEKEKTPVSGSSGDVSVANNLPSASGSGGQDANNGYATIEKSDQTTNYEISKTIKNHISESGIVKRMSIAIMVDGIYNLDEETQQLKYTERSEAELQQIKNLVKVAVGFNEDRGDLIEVMNMRFTNDMVQETQDSSEWIKEELPSIFQTLVFAIVICLILMTVIRPIALKAFEVHASKSSSLGEDENFTNATQPIIQSDGSIINVPISDLAGYGSEDSTNPQKQAQQQTNPIEKVNNLVDTHAQDLANIMRKWLKEGNNQK